MKIMDITQIIPYFMLIILVYLISIVYERFKPKQVVTPEGRAVLITGCDSGIGNQLSQRLNGMGFKVYATVLNINSIGAQELNTNALFANKMIVLEMNVTNDSQVMEVYKKVKYDLQTTGYKLWSVVNNAGVISAGLLEWGTLDTYRKLFDVNVFGTVRVSREFLPLIKTSKGRIIIMNSTFGRISMKLFGIYSMSKHSLISFTDTLRRELLDQNIKICSIEPGHFKTKMTATDNLNKIIGTVYDSSTPQVKSFYGSPDKQIKQILNFKFIERLTPDIDIAVDDIIDSITNTNPKLVYKPMAFSIRIIMIILQKLPMYILDEILK